MIRLSVVVVAVVVVLLMYLCYVPREGRAPSPCLLKVDIGLFAFLQQFSIVNFLMPGLPGWKYSAVIHLLLPQAEEPGHMMEGNPKSDCWVGMFKTMDLAPGHST